MTDEGQTMSGCHWSDFNHIIVMDRQRLDRMEDNNIEMQVLHKRRCYAVRRHATTITYWSLYLDREATTSQMGGSSAAAVTFHSLSRLFSMYPKLYSALVSWLDMGCGATAYNIRGINCTGLWIWSEGGGDMVLSLSFCLDWIVASDRSNMERALTDSA